MITVGWVRMMARYNAWQNGWMAETMSGLAEGEAERDRGAFFGSILGTANHLLWADRIWLARLAGDETPAGGVADTPRYMPDVAAWAAARRGTDARLVDWAEGLADCDGHVTWWSGVLGREASRDAATIYTHLFNHQIHHRGQIHAMLTAAGATTRDTDLIFMPEAT